MVYQNNVDYMLGRHMTWSFREEFGYLDWDDPRIKGPWWFDFVGFVRPEPQAQVGDVRVCYVPHRVAGSKLVVLRQRGKPRKRWQVVDEVLLPVRIRRALASDKLPVIARRIGRGLRPRDAVRVVLGRRLVTAPPPRPVA